MRLGSQSASTPRQDQAKSAELTELVAHSRARGRWFLVRSLALAVTMATARKDRADACPLALAASPAGRRRFWRPEQLLAAMSSPPIMLTSPAPRWSSLSLTSNTAVALSPRLAICSSGSVAAQSAGAT